MCRYKEEGAVEPFYKMEMEVMRSWESTTMYIDFAHVMRFNDVLQNVRNRTLTLIERDDDTRSWGNFLVYLSHNAMPT
jgi:hypothetical protein